MKPWEYRAKSKTPTSECPQDESLQRWASDLLTLYGRLRVETPETPDGSQVVNAPAWELHELLFYRLRAEAWGAWGVVYGRGASGEYEPMSSWGRGASVLGEPRTGACPKTGDGGVLSLKSLVGAKTKNCPEDSKPRGNGKTSRELVVLEREVRETDRTDRIYRPFSNSRLRCYEGTSSCDMIPCYRLHKAFGVWLKSVGLLVKLSQPLMRVKQWIGNVQPNRKLTKPSISFIKEPSS